MVSLRQVFARNKFPYLYLAVFLASLAIQLLPESRGLLVYQKEAVMHGEFWRIWSGQIVHFGWSHWMADAWLFLLMGRLLERDHAWLVRSALIGMPLVIIGAMTLLEPSMHTYGGLSAVNVGLLIFITLRNWSIDKFDWFWPAILGIHIVELVLEVKMGGQGGGMIPFDDSTVTVASMAHLGGIIYGVGMWLSYRMSR